MMATATAYIGRNNETKYEILTNDALVTAQTVTRAILKFSSFCIDSDVDDDLIYFEDADNQVLCMRLGMIENLRPGTYENGMLTLFDAANPNGIAWSKIAITVLSWPVCDS
jgi:hypothetical protein